MKKYPVRLGVPGFRFSAMSAGIKKNGAADLGLIVSDRPCAAAGVFTRNAVKAAPVLDCAKKLKRGVAQAVLVNSGNANACTGEAGREGAAATSASLAAALGIKESFVLPCSTGVIGVPLPQNKIIGAVPKLVSGAAAGKLPAFARSIMTTDTCPKTIALQETVGGKEVRICGIAKGSGMIMPNMATMLAFIVTDAAIDKGLLSAMLKQETELTFNRISVDGDMSTNDTVLMLAGGKSGKPVTRGSKHFATFQAMLHRVMQELAFMIVKDGEGATKLLHINVCGAASDRDARKAAAQVANSCLVKTAFFGEDFNWGRIIAAIGCSGAKFDMNRVTVFFNDILAVRNGMGIPEHREKLLRTVRKKEIRIDIDLRNGNKSCEMLTCDLSYEYVKINAEYTT